MPSPKVLIAHGIRARWLVCLIMLLTSTFLGVSQAQTRQSLESEFVSLINRERASRGLSSLVVAQDLVAVARDHSGRMAQRDVVWHDDQTPSRIKGWSAYGENVGRGYSTSQLHKAFMSSDGHRSNILYARFTQVGVGIVLQRDAIYVTQTFVRRAQQPAAQEPPRPTSPRVSRATSRQGRTPLLRPARTTVPLSLSLLFTLLEMEFPAQSDDQAREERVTRSTRTRSRGG